MPNRNLVILISFLLLILASGCAPVCTPEEIASFTPILKSPANGSEVSYNSPITFDWTHNESCRPEEYQIIIDPLYWYYTEGDKSKFDYGLGFSPGIQYQWIVKAGVKDEDGGTVFSPVSEIWTFTTDGRCSSGAELGPPTLLSPQFGEWLGEGEGSGPASVMIKWAYSGDCYPDGFHYQLAADPGFTNIITSGITNWNEHNAKIQVPRCSRLYWRVQARVGNEKGAYSEPSRFTYSSISSCFQNQQSIDASLIKGYVFEDYCATTKPYVPDGVDIWPPCTFGEPYGVHADGNRNRTAGEQEVTGETIPAELGIPGVVVDLGAGPCPATGLDQFTTVENGNYYFMVQSPGEYCVSIDKANNPNLDHGIWTLPLTDQDITQATISFNPGDDLKMQFFGWDQNDFMKIDFWVGLTSFCRFGDSKDHLVVAEVPAGEAIPIFARNEEATWFATFVNGKRCFISIASGEPAEDPNILMLFPKQPEPLDPRPTIENDSNRPTIDPCNQHTSQRDCIAATCIWHQTALGPGHCSSD